jgi:hypothetical protein
MVYGSSCRDRIGYASRGDNHWSLEDSGRPDRSFPDQEQPTKTHRLFVEGGVAFYGLALAQWSEQIARRMETPVNSYADAYRVQIHRVIGTSDAVLNVERLQRDLDLLRNWNAASTAEFAEKRACMRRDRTCKSIFSLRSAALLVH